MSTKNRIKQIARILFILVSISSLYFVPWIIVKAWIMPLPTTMQEQVEAVTNYGFDGMIVYVDKKGNLPITYTAGWHDKHNKIAAKPDALFKIASISKLYNAVAITKLANSKQLSLDASLANFFPELKDRIAYADQITLRMLVAHRSGIPSFTNTPNFWNRTDLDRQKCLELILDQPANFKPNEDYEYCNTNYLLINNIIRKITKNDHEFDYFKQVILDPLQLKNTFKSINDINMDDLMSGYYVGVEEDIKTVNYDSMIATAKDVGVFLRALNNGTLFTENEKEIYDGLYEYEHGGLIPGYQSLAKYHKESDAVIIQFMNTTKFDGYEYNLMQIFHNRMAKILEKNK
ncbi:beta-lactamase family protein [Polaribacter vadi]|uniref:serine hydrolase domain-containing protein n=1 Tax=Polaribacter TaxID=52959 RepID=UPI001C0A0F39|nr:MULTISPECIES: serine hydrolase domain-containing protein [Polaribacter]MBU3010123.1 beta-lactamase family protein [Polaribacter vadi]MDO6739930.1 serine hydrolase domain-containing protein [Polaribacter sp. 1_MG-2023]